MAKSGGGPHIVGRKTALETFFATCALSGGYAAVTNVGGGRHGKPVITPDKTMSYLTAAATDLDNGCHQTFQEQLPKGCVDEHGVLKPRPSTAAGASCHPSDFGVPRVVFDIDKGDVYFENQQVNDAIMLVIAKRLVSDTIAEFFPALKSAQPAFDGKFETCANFAIVLRSEPIGDHVRTKAPGMHIIFPFLFLPSDLQKAMRYKIAHFLESRVPVVPWTAMVDTAIVGLKPPGQVSMTKCVCEKGCPLCKNGKIPCTTTYVPWKMLAYDGDEVGEGDEPIGVLRANTLLLLQLTTLLIGAPRQTEAYTVASGMVAFLDEAALSKELNQFAKLTGYEEQAPIPADRDDPNGLYATIERMIRAACPGRWSELQVVRVIRGLESETPKLRVEVRKRGELACGVCHERRGRDHKNNRIYFVFYRNKFYQHCFDTDCKDAVKPHRRSKEVYEWPSFPVMWAEARLMFGEFASPPSSAPPSSDGGSESERRIADRAERKRRAADSNASWTSEYKRRISATPSFSPSPTIVANDNGDVDGMFSDEL